MGAWTNVDVPQFSEWQRDEYEAKLLTERDIWKSRAENLRAALENIPQAIKQYGYCDITDSNGVTVRVAKLGTPVTGEPGQES